MKEPLIPEWLGLSLAGQGRTAAALAELRPISNLEPPRPEALYNLALVERAAGDPANAVRILERVLTLRPYQALAWLQLGLARREAEPENTSRALAAFERAVAVEPASARSTVVLAEELERLGREEDALRVLRHGLRVVREPSRVRAALAERESVR